MGLAVSSGALALLPPATIPARGGPAPEDWFAIFDSQGAIIARTFARTEARAWALLSISDDLRAACEASGHTCRPVMLADRSEWPQLRADYAKAADLLADVKLLVAEAARVELALSAACAMIEGITIKFPGLNALNDRRAFEAAIERVQVRLIDGGIV